jgi:dihydroxyacetone kinase-like protein
MMLTLQRFKEMIAAAGEAIRAGEKRFSELDAAAGGDGDHGTAIVTAFQAMAKAGGADFKGYLKALSEALQNEACGSTSTLYGSWLQGMSDTAPEGAAELDAAELAKVFNGGLEELGFVTRARVGDKTLMDALIPATEALLKASARCWSGRQRQRSRGRKPPARCAPNSVARKISATVRSGRATPARRRWPAFLRLSRRRSRHHVKRRESWQI